jgi:hypothetical protein
MATTATGWGTRFTTNGFTLATIVTQESATAGGFFTMGAITSGTTARQLGLGQNSADLMTLIVGTTEITFAGTTPTLDQWYLKVVTKATGTVTPVGYYLNMNTLAFSGAISGSGTVANRTAGVCVGNLGSFGAGDYWDGRIAMYAMYDRVLRIDEVLNLAQGPRAWYGAIRSEIDDIWDVTYTTGNFLSYRNPSFAFSAGTPPALSPGSPPGWP